MISNDELLQSLHDHQAELEMQNEELRNAHIALEESRTRYLSLYEFAPVGYLTLTREGLIDEINLTGATLLGMERHQLIHHRFSALVANKDGDRWHLFFQQLIHDNVEHDFELELHRGDHSPFDAQLHCKLITDNDKLPTIRLTLTDISQRKRLELVLRIVSTAFESHGPMVICNTDKIILQANKAFTNATGYTEKEIIGQKISLLKSNCHDKAFYTEMWQTIHQVGTWQGEIWAKHKSGQVNPILLTISAVKDSDHVVTHYVGSFIDITEQKLAEEKIKHLAFYDSLTQLPNRCLLQERLKHSIEMARRDNKPLALLMLDLDRFKAVNDNLGHMAGDELLQQVAARMTARLRTVDMVSRLGGDEFIVLLDDIAHPDDAARVAEEIINDLSKPFNLSQSDDVCIGVSIGISLYPQHGGCPETLLDHADAALYQAKDQGRGCFSYFSEALTRAAQERIALEVRLRKAIEQNELRMLYQPQIAIKSGRIIGTEALVYWQDPIAGLISPIGFIPIAEESHLIVEIGAWVLRESCQQAKQWLDSGLLPITIAVNVSPHQFRRSDINALVTNILLETGLPAEQLELEITESGLMENQDFALDILNNLRHQGIRLAIDDFGRGYSSLSRLKYFPVNVLKIDKSFIENIPANKDDMEIASTIVAMAHNLGFKVLAEGVETSAQLDFLREKGCDAYQGHIKNKPLSAQAFAELLAKEQSQGPLNPSST
jgi:diguanylate cyclase (GGDEF)-like protein/PAS domain S-box-containing protein